MFIAMCVCKSLTCCFCCFYVRFGSYVCVVDGILGAIFIKGCSGVGCLCCVVK